PTGRVPFSIVAGDLNGDGKTDLATNGFDEETVCVLLNDGDGTFAPKVEYPAPGVTTFMAVGDLNGDAKPDLAVGTVACSVSAELKRGWGAGAQMMIGPVPPSAPHAEPVTYEARSELRNAITAAISSGSASRPSGRPAPTFASTSSRSPCWSASPP